MLTKSISHWLFFHLKYCGFCVSYHFNQAYLVGLLVKLGKWIICVTEMTIPGHSFVFVFFFLKCLKVAKLMDKIFREIKQAVVREVKTLWEFCLISIKYFKTCLSSLIVSVLPMGCLSWLSLACSVPENWFIGYTQSYGKGLYPFSEL